MVWVRRGVVKLLSLLLLVSLIGGALAVSAKLNLSKPDKIEAWLNQSNFYTGVVDSALTQAQQAAAKTGNLNISFNDDAVQQAAHTALTPQLVQQDITTFLDSNYAWLQGKTSTPSFTIDLSGPKQAFAEQVAQAAQARLASLPVCTAAQQAQLQAASSVNPLTIDCRPSFLDPATEAAQLKADLLSGNNFLANSTLTANTPTPNISNQNKPYYQQFSQLPKAYRLAMDVPWIAAVVAFLSAVGVFLIATSRRKGLWHIGGVLLISGIVLIATKFIADDIFRVIEHHVFNNSSIGQLQQALTSFFGLMEHNLVRVDLWFGVVYAGLAAVLLVGLLLTRNRLKQAVTTSAPMPKTPVKNSLADVSTPQPNTAQPQTKSRPPRPPRPPRLIQ